MPANTVPQEAAIQVPESIMRQLRDLVSSGAASSEEQFVQEALKRQISRVRRERLRAEFAKAAKDPEFLRDMNECMHDFRFADAETAAMIDDD